jgi:hypothetical protein
MTASRVEAVLRAASIGGPAVSTSRVASIVSPMCRAADWTCLAVHTADDACFIKLRESDAAGFVTVADAAAGARCAAELGLTPALRSVQPDALVFDLLPPPWREARLGDLAQPEMLGAVLAAKRRLQRGPPLARQWDVFGQIDRLFLTVSDAPAELAGMRAAVTAIGAALSASDQERVPCHADGTASNIMLHPDGRVRLVDFDCAGMSDPHYDFGVTLNEVCTTETEWQAGIEAAFGRSTRRDLARCRAYAAADDFFWALWGISCHAASTRGTLEFLKYGHWRLLRCRMALRRPDCLHDL